ncbi:MAG TPA: peptidylprolyl isomerase [Candidatus Thermoplasmatota archaeon]|nr:peptidylprolyl isomerase [Candidatus Thermoplasmatota archaeon]
MMRPLAAALLLSSLLLSGCSKDEASDLEATVRFEFQLPRETFHRNFTMETLPEHAPLNVANFLQYVDDGFYDGLTFHRIAPGFVVQGGSVYPDMQSGPDTRDPVKLEAREGANVQWTIAMARTGKDADPRAPDTATSSFFINLEDNRDQLDPNAFSEGYTVVGRILDGKDNITAMLTVERGRSFGPAGGYYPKEPIIIHHAGRES